MEPNHPNAPLMRARDLSEDLSDASDGMYPDLALLKSPSEHSQQHELLNTPHAASISGIDTRGEDEPSPSLLADADSDGSSSPSRSHSDAYLVFAARAALRLLDEAEEHQEPYQQHEQSDADDETSSSETYESDFSISSSASEAHHSRSMTVIWILRCKTLMVVSKETW